MDQWKEECIYHISERVLSSKDNRWTLGPIKIDTEGGQLKSTELVDFLTRPEDMMIH